MLNVRVQFLVFCIDTLVSRVTFLAGQTDTGVCEHKDDTCGVTFDSAFQLYPNFREKRTPDLINLFGYPAETHNVKTEDGYILSVQRIPFSKTSRPSTRKIPVFLMHGGFASSGQWFGQPPQRALVFMLADAGYDVWIGNARGTSYSQGHVSLPINDRSDRRYWNYSQHEFALFDNPAVINYITDLTGHKRIYWVGHSIGVAQIYMALSLRPELNSRIRAVFGMAPSAFAGHITNPIFKAVSPFYARYPFGKLLDWIGKGKTVPDFVLDFFLTPATNTCQESWVDCNLCGNVMYLIFGYSCQLNFTMLPGTFAHVPDDMSVKTMSHYSQWQTFGRFAQFDYGSRLNLQHYGTSTPPDYDMSKVHVPSVFYRSDGDSFVVAEDVKLLADSLGDTVKEINVVPYEDFTHGDFIIGIDADKYIYNNIIEAMNSRKYG